MTGGSSAAALQTAESVAACLRWKRHARRLALLATALLASTSFAGSRTAADGKYAVHDALDAGGGRAKSQNSAGRVYTNDASLGGIGGLSVAPGAVPSRTVKHGYAGQLYDMVGVVLEASPTTVAEGETRQLSARDVLDDGTFLAVSATNVSWSVLDGPITSISTNGVATAAIVARDTDANVQAARPGFSSSLTLSVLNVGTDDFGPYAGDQIDDNWQVTYFGESSADAAPQLDPDGDGEDNLAEFRTNTIPTDASSVTRSARALNIATRLRVLRDDNVLIGGFIIAGSEPKNVIIRGIGPSLGSQGVADALADPVLQLFDAAGNSIAANDNWRDTQAADIEATGIPPNDGRESAIVRTLAPGSYTAVVSGTGGGIGIGLVEFYDLAAGEPARLANIATRGFVDSGDNVMIGGFIIGAGLGTNGSGTARLLVRAIGPSLFEAGVANALQDPTLDVINGNGDAVASNNNWKESQQAEIEATTIPPRNDLESAVVQAVPAGLYTAVVRGVGGGTGVGLVEVYALQ